MIAPRLRQAIADNLDIFFLSCLATATLGYYLFVRHLDSQLWFAAQQGDTGAMTALLKRGANPKARQHNVTALYEAVSVRSIPAVKVLMEHGANIYSENGVSSYGHSSPISHAADLFTEDVNPYPQFGNKAYAQRDLAIIKLLVPPGHEISAELLSPDAGEVLYRHGIHVSGVPMVDARGWPYTTRNLRPGEK